jgi:broad specificity phosphatase PhoE
MNIFKRKSMAEIGLLKCIVIRHGATKMNSQTDMSEDRIRGWRDVPLVAAGREEAHQAAADLSTEDIEVIVNSDLSRAEETAEIIGKDIGVKNHSTPLLRPWNLGVFTGKPTTEVLESIRRYACNTPDKSVPEGESFNTFCHRAARGLKTAFEIAGGKNLCIVTHHRDERFFFAWKAAGFPPDLGVEIKVFLEKGEAPGALMPFEIPRKALERIGK